MNFLVKNNSDHETLFILIVVSGVTLLMLVQSSANIISNDYHYVYAASKNKNDTTTGHTSTDETRADDTASSTPIGSKTFLTVTTKVSGGTSKPSDFTITVSGKSPSPKSFSGSSSGNSVTLNAGKYKVIASGPSDYTTSYSSGCSGTARGGTPVGCTISNKYIGATPGSITFLNVITNVDNSNGGNKKPSDFTITVTGNNPFPSSFSGSSGGTDVTLKSGSYKVREDKGIPGYTTSYSSGCSGTANGGVPIKCTVTNKYTASPAGSTTFLNVITKVINNNQGTKKPSDFTIIVSGKNPSPSSFSGSSSGTSVTLSAGTYKVIVTERPAGYTTSYSSGCSGTASEGTPIKCTISNQYRNRPSPQPQPPVPNVTITTNSNSVYSIPSTSVQVDRFSTNYTIAGTISSLINSKDLITSTIVNDFDKNPNIGYIVNDSSGSQALSTPSQIQPGIPNPFVSIDMINQKITNVIQDAMGANTAYSTNSPEKHVEIKCTFGMILAYYNCS
jgi:prealbumin domain-containing protein